MQIKIEVAHAMVLEPVQTGPEIKSVLYTAAGKNGPTWGLWQKAPDRYEVTYLDSGVRDTKAQKLITLQQKRKYYLPMMEFELLLRWLEQSHICFWHPGYKS